MTDVALPRAGRGMRARLQGSAVVDGLLGKAGELAAQALMIAVLPRALGPVDYGTFALCLSIVTLASSSIAIGGPTLMSRFVPAAAPAQRDAVARALAMRVGRWRVLGLVVAALAAVVLALTLPGSFPAVLTALVTIALALDVMATLAFQIALGMGRTAMWSNRFGVQNLALVLAAAAGYALAGVQGAVAGILVASAMTLAWGWIAVWPRLQAAPRDAEIPPGAMRFGSTYAASNLLVMLEHRGGVIAVSLLAASTVQAGFAAIALGVALAGTYVITQVYIVHLPGLVEGKGMSVDEPEAEATLRRLTVRFIAVVAPLAVLGVVALHDLLPLVVGQRFRGAEPAIAIALATLPVVPLAGNAGQVAALRLLMRPRFLTALGGAVGFVITALLAVPHFAAAGAAAALLAGGICTALSAFFLIPRAISPLLMATGMAASGAVVLTALLTGSIG
jgi:O-antigen/teichoic acid export membrane protein